MSNSQDDQPDWSLFEDHEGGSKTRYTEMQRKLAESADDEGALRLLAARLDVQLKLEDFLIKFREAEHRWLRVWGPILTSAIVSIVVVVLAYFLHTPKN
jgi:hypothetical protein